MISGPSLIHLYLPHEKMRNVTSKNLLVLSLLGVSDHVLDGGGGLAAQFCEAHGHTCSLAGYSVILVMVYVIVHSQGIRAKLKLLVKLLGQAVVTSYSHASYFVDN